jgi:hypothetical protein
MKLHGHRQIRPAPVVVTAVAISEEFGARWFPAFSAGHQKKGGSSAALSLGI